MRTIIYVTAESSKFCALFLFKCFYLQFEIKSKGNKKRLAPILNVPIGGTAFIGSNFLYDQKNATAALLHTFL